MKESASPRSNLKSGDVSVDVIHTFHKMQGDELDNLVNLEGEPEVAERLNGECRKAEPQHSSPF